MEHWGLINFHVFPDLSADIRSSEESILKTLVDLPSTTSLFPNLLPPENVQSPTNNNNNNSKKGSLLLASHKDILSKTFQPTPVFLFFFSLLLKFDKFISFFSMYVEFVFKIAVVLGFIAIEKNLMCVQDVMLKENFQKI